MQIGNTIRMKRRTKDMTQEQLAEKMNVSISAVSQWECGKSIPDLTMIPALCSVLDVSADELLGVDQAKKK
ncbi:MAG: helix-turn-helix transcriptional regulator, partial [Clostridia bacterium]|nr:helix-turn-helix transcriptional regulator [Clostridia bacterium]